VRVKLWKKDGPILYSDEPALIGSRFTLDNEELELVKAGRAEAELSDLDDPENRFERPQGKLLEAHTTIRTPGGTQRLFEVYERFSSVDAGSTRLLGALAPPLIAGSSCSCSSSCRSRSMARRLQRGHRERETLLANAVDASAQERRRRAGPRRRRLRPRTAGPRGAAPQRYGRGRRAAGGHRHAAPRGARAAHAARRDAPHPQPRVGGPARALSDPRSPLHTAGERRRWRSRATRRQHRRTRDELVYRVAPEAMRTGARVPSSVRVAVRRPQPGATQLVVADDGAGFAAPQRDDRATQGHLSWRCWRRSSSRPAERAGAFGARRGHDRRDGVVRTMIRVLLATTTA
jgi:two-component system NarL family sensor kinase